MFCEYFLPLMSWILWMNCVCFSSVELDLGISLALTIHHVHTDGGHEKAWGNRQTERTWGILEGWTWNIAKIVKLLELCCSCLSNGGNVYRMRSFCTRGETILANTPNTSERPSRETLIRGVQVATYYNIYTSGYLTRKIISIKQTFLVFSYIKLNMNTIFYIQFTPFCLFFSWSNFYHSFILIKGLSKAIT